MEREQIILSLQPTVERCAWRAFIRWPKTDWEDYVSIAWIGAIEAIDAFNDSLGVPLEFWVKRTVMLRIIDYVRSASPGKRRVQTHKISVIGWNAEAPELKHLPAPEIRLMERIRAHQIMEALDDKNRTILRERFLEDRQMKEIGHSRGSNESRGSQLVAQALKKAMAAGA